MKKISWKGTILMGKYFWFTGEFVNFDKGRDSDVWALEHNFVSWSPYNLTLQIRFENQTRKSWKF
jgi:5'-nucleotidase